MHADANHLDCVARVHDADLVRGRAGVQQVLELLQVDFQERGLHEALLKAEVADAFEDVLERARDNAARVAVPAIHCVGLARARLAVRKDGAVVALERAVHDGLCCHGEHVRLRRV